MSASADRNLLLGILALQMDFISRDQLVTAMNAWVLAKDRPLANILAEQGALKTEHRTLLGALVQAHLAQHGNDPAQSLAAVSSLGSAKKRLEQIADADVQASLSVVATIPPGDAEDPYATRRQPTIGQPTSAGLRFRILRPHAEGGLGRVSVAEDGELHREVALKEIKDRYADHAGSRARFLLEAEVTGGLEHPGIVPVYGLGTYADGRPFYAMRFIRGDSLKEAIDHFHKCEDDKPRRLARADFEGVAFRSLLGRFVDVCQAIAYAHNRRVLHRDLKPGNIMLGKYGETLVVDWGLAKPLADKGPDEKTLAPAADVPLRPASASGTDETLPGMAIGTPEYMSPEQAEGRWDIIGPASDIYSLGATLFTVLTGRSPVAGPDVGEMLRRVQRGQIATARQVCPAVPPALEAICRKAQALNPADRYASALDLAADVEHWLADEPVTAWREPLNVRAWRWVRWHRTLATTAAALVLATAAGLGLLALEKERARVAVANEQAETAKERDRANDERDAKEVERQLAEAARKDAEAQRNIASDQRHRTRVAIDKLTSEKMIARLGGENGITEGQREFLRTALSYYREFSTEGATENEDRLPAAEANYHAGCLLKTLVEREEAISAFSAALKIYERLASDFPDRPSHRQRLAATHMSLAFLYSDIDRPAEAESALRAAVAIQEKLVAEYPDVTNYRYELASGHADEGTLLAGMGKRAEAVPAYQKALLLQEKLVIDEADKPLFRLDLARWHAKLASLYEDLGKRGNAETEYRAAIACDEGLIAYYSALSEMATGRQQNPSFLFTDLPNIHGDLAANRGSLGSLLVDLGRQSAAETEIRTALATLGKLVDANPESKEFSSAAADSCCKLGWLLSDMGKRDQAEAAFRSAMAIMAKLTANFPDAPEYRGSLADVHVGLGATLTGRGKHKEAEAEFRAALAIQEDLAADFPAVPSYRNGRADCLCRLGVLFADSGNRTEAEIAYRDSLLQYEVLVDECPDVPYYRSSLAYCHYRLGVLLAESGKASGADASFRAALAIQKKLSEDAPDLPYYRNVLAYSYTGLGTLLQTSGKRDEAGTAFQAALSQYEVLTKAFPNRTDFRLSRADVLARSGSAARAAADAEELAAAKNADEMRTYDCACALAVASAAPNNSAADAYAARAVELLRQAIARGYADIPHLLADADLAPLRRRADYIDLLWDIAETPAAPAGK